MKTRLRLRFLAGISALLVSAAGALASHPFLCSDSRGNKVALVSADKKMVWAFADHAHFKTINQIQVLDAPGDLTRGEILR